MIVALYLYLGRLYYTTPTLLLKKALPALIHLLKMSSYDLPADEIITPAQFQASMKLVRLQIAVPISGMLPSARPYPRGSIPVHPR